MRINWEKWRNAPMPLISYPAIYKGPPEFQNSVILRTSSSSINDLQLPYISKDPNRPPVYQAANTSNNVQSEIIVNSEEAMVNNENVIEAEEPDVRLVKLSRIVRIIALVKVGLMLVYMLPVFVLLPFLVVDAFGYLAARALNYRLLVGFIIALSALVAFRVLAIIGLGVVMEDGSMMEGVLIKLMFAMFLIILPLECAQLWFVLTFIKELKGVPVEKKLQLIEIMKTKQVSWCDFKINKKAS